MPLLFFVLASFKLQFGMPSVYTYFSCLGKKSTKRSRAKGVAERSGFNNAMVASGNHTTIPATGNA